MVQENHGALRMGQGAEPQLVKLADGKGAGPVLNIGKVYADDSQFTGAHIMAGMAAQDFFCQCLSHGSSEHV
jgi:hypothetical protein